MVTRRIAPKADEALQLRFGALVKDYRQRLGITQEELAWRANMHRTYVADIERGSRNVSLRRIGNLADALQIPVERLMADPGSPESMGSARRRGGEILLVEDGVEDAALTVRAFARAHVTNPVRVVKDGEEALEYLFRTGRHAALKRRDRPQLVLLDLNLPGVSGLEVLRRMKADASTRRIPVVVLTASRHDRDIIECSQLGAENYVIKPVSFDGFSKVVPKLSFEWALVRRDTAPSQVVR